MALSVKALGFGLAALAGLLLVVGSKKAKAATPAPSPEPVPIPVPPVPPVSTGCPPLDSGSIAKAQAKLNVSGAATPPLAVDGVYGPRTQAAVLKFQAGEGLIKTGCLDGPTLNALEPFVAGPAPAIEYLDAHGLHWQIDNPSTGVWRGIYVDDPARYGGPPTLIVRDTLALVKNGIDEFSITHPIVG